MDHRPATPTAQSDSEARRIRLAHATIAVDGEALVRRAQFTDGSAHAVTMQWGEVRRVAAFRRDVMTSPVLCMAITDAANVVVLDEMMSGWAEIVEALPRYLGRSADFGEWKLGIGPGSAESFWSVLFPAGQ